MSEVYYLFFNSKTRYNVLDLNNFFDKLENAIIHRESMDTIRLPINSFDEYNQIKFESQRRDLILIQLDEKYKKIIDHLERNKYKIKKERKIEIFKTWFYWLSAANSNIWVNQLYSDEKKFYREIFSFQNLHETARSILFEVENLNCCYDYYNTEFDLNDGKMTSSILEEMYIQPDILCRAICSNTTENVKLLAENGFNLVKHYKHPKLKSGLHWAYYCDNLEMFNYLIENGYKVDENDIFYDPQYQKNFKFTLYLHFYKEKREDIYKSLKFDDLSFLTNFKLYEHYQNNDDIINLYENMFKIGFSLTVKTETCDQAFLQDEKKILINVTQFATAISQTNINSFTIRFLKRKLDNECKNNQIIIQEYLVNFFKHINNVYSHSLLHSFRNKENRMRLSSSDVLRILTEVLPLLNNKSILMLNKKQEFTFMYERIIGTYCDKFETITIEGSNDYPKYLYDRKSFKIIDLIIKYNILPNDYYFELLFHLFGFWTYDDKKYWEHIEIMALYFYYLLDNKFTSSKKVMEYFNKWLNLKRLNSILGPPKVSLLINTLNFVLNLNICLTNSLAKLAKFEIKNAIKCTSNEILSQLELPIDALNEIKNTTKLNQKTFYEYYSNKEKYINKIIKTKFKWFENFDDLLANNISTNNDDDLIVNRELSF
jgi:hypothetical protein